MPISAWLDLAGIVLFALCLFVLSREERSKGDRA
jgi:hypothetical protein